MILKKRESVVNLHKNKNAKNHRFGQEGEFFSVHFHPLDFLCIFMYNECNSGLLGFFVMPTNRRVLKKGDKNANI